MQNILHFQYVLDIILHWKHFLPTHFFLQNEITFFLYVSVLDRGEGISAIFQWEQKQKCLPVSASKIFGCWSFFVNYHKFGGLIHFESLGQLHYHMLKFSNAFIWILFPTPTKQEKTYCCQLPFVTGSEKWPNTHIQMALNPTFTLTLTGFASCWILCHLQ